MQNVKSNFEQKYKNKINNRPVFTRQVFYESNDQVFFWDLPIKERNALKNDENDIKLVNILVANNDYVSICPEIDGDIMITDINRTLLNYINQHTKKIIHVYERYKNNQINFNEAKAEIEKFYEQHGSYNRYQGRKDALGSKHFLYNEERFNTCLTSLKNKQIETININLMDENEQTDLASFLKKEEYKINMVNLTNLPDYDADALLIPFCEKLPMNPAGGLFVLNVHDRGINKAYDRYDHALFHTTSIDGLKKIYNETIPDAFAKYDKRQHGENTPNPVNISKSFLGTNQKQRYDQTYLQYTEIEPIDQIFIGYSSVFRTKIEYFHIQTLNRFLIKKNVNLDTYEASKSMLEAMDLAFKHNIKLSEPMLEAMDLAFKHNIKLSEPMLEAMDLALNKKNSTLTLSELQVLDVPANHFRKCIVSESLIVKFLSKNKLDEFLLEQYVSNRQSEKRFTNSWCYLFGLNKHEKWVKVKTAQKMLKIIRGENNVERFTPDEIKAIQQKDSNLNKAFKALNDDNQSKIYRAVKKDKAYNKEIEYSDWDNAKGYLCTVV